MDQSCAASSLGSYRDLASIACGPHGRCTERRLKLLTGLRRGQKNSVNMRHATSLNGLPLLMDHKWAMGWGLRDFSSRSA